MRSATDRQRDARGAARRRARRWCASPGSRRVRPRWPAGVRTATGHWEGCESVFPEGHRDFRYRASARIDAGSAAARPYLDALAPALEAAGLSDAAPGERPGGRTLGGTVGEVEVRLSELPGQGDYVLLDASGPCVDVPADQREEWEGRPDPAPIVE